MTYSAPHSQAREDATACGCQEHRALLSAIKLRDPREAARLMREHLERLESQLSFAPTRDSAPDLMQLFAGANNDRSAGPPQARSAPSGGSDPRSGGAWGRS
jgi:hypothetical protein